MSVSANTKKEPWFGNQDLAKKHPLKNHRDKVNYVLSFTPVRHVQIGKHVQIVEATEIARVQVFTPRDYDRIINPGKQAGGDGENYFQRSKTTKVRILHDPTIKAEAPALTSTTGAASDEKSKKQTRRSSAEVAAEKAQKAAEKAKLASEAGIPETEEVLEDEDELTEEGEEEQDA